MSERPIWDGNGGALDPATATTRDYLVALHVKMDTIVLPALRTLTQRQAETDRGEFTGAQERAILTVVSKDEDKRLNRRALRAPVFAVGISILTLAATIILTLTSGVGHG